MGTALLLIIAAILPWVVHSAPARHRALALVGAVAVVLLYAIFRANPLANWGFWLGLAVGVGSVVLVGRRGSAPGGDRGSIGSRRHQDDPDGSQPTGEIPS